jgi:hypothetical protein
LKDWGRQVALGVLGPFHSAKIGEGLRVLGPHDIGVVGRASEDQRDGVETAIPLASA